MKYIKLIQNKNSKQTTLNVPVELAKQLRDSGVEIMKAHIDECGRLIYTQIKVVD